MTCLARPGIGRRSPRYRLSDVMPTVLEFPNGRRAPGELQTISLTGGLISLDEPLDKGAKVAVCFRAHNEHMALTAEMLVPIGRNEQPFRFIRLPEGDEHRLRNAFQSGFYRNIEEEELIEELKASVLNSNFGSGPRLVVIAVRLVVLAVLAVALVGFALHAHILGRL